MTAQSTRASALDLSLLRFLRARVPVGAALNDALPPRRAELAPPALAAELLRALRTAPRDRDVPARLDGLLAQLHCLDLDRLVVPQQRLAFWLNCYNALMLDAVRRFGLRASVRERPGFYRLAAYRIGGERFSAEEIEHGILRGNRAPHPRLPPLFALEDPRRRHSLVACDPRIHFVLNCATRSCPPLRVYEAADLEEQLDRATAGFLNGGGVEWDASERTAILSSLFAYYAEDFGAPEALAGFIERYLERPQPAAAIGAAVAAGCVRYRTHDWSLPGMDDVTEKGSDAG